MTFCSKMRFALSAGALLISQALGAQQEHPNRATGFRSETLYSSGKDDVNLFNGNLSYSIPLGEGVPVGPSLSLGVRLTYNSKTFSRWTVTNTCSQPVVPLSEDHPDGERTVGLGWSLHFGRLVHVPTQREGYFTGCGSTPARAGTDLPPTFPKTMLATGVAFQTPAGSVHEFYDLDVETPTPPSNLPRRCWDPNHRTELGSQVNCFVYTHDGSFLRMDPLDPSEGHVPVVYFPDGLRYVMRYQGGRTPTHGSLYSHNSMEFASPSFPESNVKLAYASRIVDRHGNAIQVRYYGETVPGNEPVPPPHPHAAKPIDARDVLPWRAFPEGRSETYIEFTYLTRDIIPIPSTTDTMAYISSVLVPHPSGAGHSTYSLSSELRTVTASGLSRQVPVLTGVSLPENLAYSFGYEPNLPIEAMLSLQQITLPSGGKLLYEYANFNTYTYQRDKCSDAQSNPCTGNFIDGYRVDTGTGVSKRTERRKVAITRGGAATDEDSVTYYVRSAPADTPGFPCDNEFNGANWANCRVRTDVWVPSAGALGGKVNATRTVFHETNGLNGAYNRALYGKPIQTLEYSLAPPTGVPTPELLQVSGLHPFQRTSFSYQFDGFGNSTFADGDRSRSEYFNHNTREKSRTIERIDPSTGNVLGSITINNRYPGSLDSPPPGYRWLGHWFLTETKEKVGGGPELTLQSETRSHHEDTNAWILEPLVSRTLFRLADASDPAGANLSSTETNTIDASSGFIREKLVVDDAGRALKTTYVKGTGLPTGVGGPCLDGANESVLCANAGFPKEESTELLPAPSSIYPISKYTKRFFYKYGVLAAAMTVGTTFYSPDRDISASGKIVGERGPEGRSDVSATGTTSLTLTTSYDGLGRVTARRQTNLPGVPDQGEDRTVYGPQDIASFRCPATLNPVGCADSAALSYNRIFFDQLGRATAEVRRMPGSTGYSYRIRRYGLAGRVLADSEWLALTASQCSGAGGPCASLQNFQPSVSASSLQDGATLLPSTISWDFDEEGRATATRKIDGGGAAVEEATSAFVGWWSESRTRKFNAANTPAQTIYERNGLSQLYRVTEPAAATATGGSMNVADTTTYRYDHMNRLIRVQKTGGDASGGPANVTQDRTWKYNDFGWLVSQTSPEGGNMALTYDDAQGNPTLVTTGNRSIASTFDAAGRVRSRSHELTPGNWEKLEEYVYDHSPNNAYGDPFHYPNIQVGRANGRLVLAVRHNRPITQVQAGPENLTDYGIIDNIDLFHYGGPAAQLSVRQRWVYYLTNGPPAERPEDALAGATDKGTGKERAEKRKKALKRYFEAQGQSFRRTEDALAAGAILDPVVPTRTGPQTGGARSARASLSPANDPQGWINWMYLYDYDGRLEVLQYPRRDEGYPNTIRTNVIRRYDNGWVKEVEAWFNNPFDPATPYGFLVTNTFNPSGSPSLTEVRRKYEQGNTAKLFSLTSSDFAASGKVGSWAVTRTPADLPVESTVFNYDKSGNLIQRGARSFSYDARGRLIRETGSPAADYTYDGFGNLVNYGGVLLVPQRTDNRLASVWPLYTEYDSTNGNVVGEVVSLPGGGQGKMEYDWYPDGRRTSEYRADANHEAYLGGTVFVLDHKGEKALHYFGTEGDCPGQLFRYPLLDEGGQTLSEYRGTVINSCSCEPSEQCLWSAQFEKDYVWAGANVLLTRNRTGVQLHARDYLGSVRHTFDLGGALLVSNDQLKAYGDGPQPFTGERHLFTGQERQHMAGEQSSVYGFVTDYMHARGYVPSEGRFLSLDEVAGSIIAPQSWNRYSYGLGSPLKYVDPDGRATKLAEAVAGTFESAGWALSQAGLSVNQGGNFGIALDTTLATAGDVVGGMGDMFRVGDAIGEVKGSGGDGYAMYMAASKDFGRASALFVSIGGAAGGWLEGTATRGANAGTLAGKCVECTKAYIKANPGATEVRATSTKFDHWAARTADGKRMFDPSLRDNLKVMGLKYRDVAPWQKYFSRQMWEYLTKRFEKIERIVK